MSHPEDWEFRGTIEKETIPPKPDDPWSASNLSIASLVMGILGITLLPLLGSIMAIAYGHMANLKIGRSRDRLEGGGLARAGLAIGYLEVGLYVFAALVVGVSLLRGLPSGQTIVTKDVEILTPAPVKTGIADVPKTAGVKMANQMGRGDYRLIEGTRFDVKPGEIIGCYNSGKPAADPELALLTTRKLLYLKDGRTTEFDLKDVSGLKDDQAFEKAYRQTLDSSRILQTDFDLSTYHVEVKSTQGPRMHIEIRPERDGAIFFDALQGAALAAGAKLEAAGR